MEKRIFEELGEGEISVEEPDMSNVAISLRNKYPNSFSRIEQVKQILDCFIGGRKKEN